LGLKWAPVQKDAGAGTNNLVVTIPKGAIIKVINSKNRTTDWLQCSLGMMRSGDDNDSGIVVTLVSNNIQTANSLIHWEGEIEVGELDKVRARWLTCVADDDLNLTVGYE